MPDVSCGTDLVNYSKVLSYRARCQSPEIPNRPTPKQQHSSDTDDHTNHDKIAIIIVAVLLLAQQNPVRQTRQSSESQKTNGGETRGSRVAGNTATSFLPGRKNPPPSPHTKKAHTHTHTDTPVRMIMVLVMMTTTPSCPLQPLNPQH